jgi:uncharacterized membrane protein
MVAIRRMERLIGFVLLAGVLTSAAIVFFGGALYMWRHGSTPVHYRIFRGEPSDLRSLSGIWKDFTEGSGRGAIQFGLMLLVGIQVIRVALTGILFLLNRDKVFVVITFLVLALLSYALFFAGE